MKSPESRGQPRGRARPERRVRTLCGALAMVGVLAFIVVVAALHVLQPGYDAAQQLMSELALGPHGGAMLWAFASIAIALGAIERAVAALGASWAVRALLALAAAAFLVAGLLPLGETSTEHIAAIATAFVLAVLAMYLFPALAGRASSLAGRPVSWTCAAGVAASVALGHSLVPMGVGQRLAAFFLLAWIASIGWGLAWKERLE